MKRSLIFLSLLPLACLAGCKHGPSKPKENPAVATEIEESFKQRWVEKRAGELMALGLRPDLARQQAIDEFRVRYGYTHAATGK
jgi:D-tyrosyl-tRNA(Tyr) deacylase